MRKVLILCNLPQRDMASDQILATKLRELGFEVRVVPFLPRPREHILYYKPDIVVGPEARCEFTIDMYDRCMEWGVAAVAKRTEGGAARAAWDVMDQAERDTVIGSWTYNVDREIVWSMDFADLLGEHGYIPREHVDAVGAIPFDVYFQPPNREPWSKRRNIMLATGWGHADRNPQYNVPEAEPDSPIHADAYNRHREGREKWIELMSRMREELPSTYNLFVRLKVGEQPNEYQQKLGNKVQILMPCDTKVALMNTDLLIHAGSTMGIEAHLMNIPALSYMGLQNQTPGYQYPHVSPDITDPGEIIKMVQTMDWTKSNADTSAVDQLEKEFYGWIDGKACERAAAAIAQIPEKETNVPNVWPAEKKDYPFPGTAKHYMGWKCETCDRITYTLDMTRDMVKCNHCGISLARRQ
jgi:surface carbohydrate biosynthesis protein